MFKVNNKDTRTVNFEHISHLVSSVSIVNFEQVNAGWDIIVSIVTRRFIPKIKQTLS